MGAVRILGLDPGLRRTGWGLIDVDGNRLAHVANGTIATKSITDLAPRLAELFVGLEQVIDEWMPTESAVEKTFVNKDPVSTLKLGQARGVILLAPAKAGLAVAEYAPNLVKKSVVGSGHAQKAQIHAMVSVLLPAVKIDSPDSADALAVAICHAHHRTAPAIARAI
jgi:crossover junction endodeoxyribonuclease RuvC